MVNKYKEYLPKLTVAGFKPTMAISFSKEVLEACLKHPQSEGIHFFFGVDSNDRLTLTFKAALEGVPISEPGESGIVEPQVAGTSPHLQSAAKSSNGGGGWNNIGALYP